MTRQVVLDIQTTGLEPEQGHRLVEIACVEIEDGQLTGHTFHRYVNPDRDMSRSAIQESGITGEFLSRQPRFHEIEGALIAFLAGAELLIHNAPFELAFINAELLRLGHARLHSVCSRVTDTLTLARKIHPRRKNTLDVLCARYGVDRRSEIHRGALMDAMLLAEVYLAGFASLRVDLPKGTSAASFIWTPDMDAELLARLRKDPKAMFDLSPRRFEELIAAIFRNNGFLVELTPQTRDGGVDIIAVQRSSLCGDLIHLIECKRYAPTRTVGVGVVQRLLGSVLQRRATTGVVVTSSSFTRDAVRAAQESRHVMALKDYDAISGWLKEHVRSGQLKRS